MKAGSCISNDVYTTTVLAPAIWKWVGKTGGGIMSKAMPTNQTLMENWRRRDQRWNHTPVHLKVVLREWSFLHVADLGPVVRSALVHSLLAAGGRASCFQEPREVCAAFQGSRVKNRTLFYVCLFSFMLCLLFSLSFPYVHPRHQWHTENLILFNSYLSCVCSYWWNITCETISSSFCGMIYVSLHTQGRLFLEDNLY